MLGVNFVIMSVDGPCCHAYFINESIGSNLVHFVLKKKYEKRSGGLTARTGLIRSLHVSLGYLLPEPD